MADSIDRVFVYALNTVKKLPRGGSTRPPPNDRLRLYGLYKQAMEGDVEGVMLRPVPSRDREGKRGDADGDEDMLKEQQKWDAWDSQKGVSRTEAKRRYIEALIQTMHRYASQTADARELVAELEFVWDQIKHNSPGSSSHSSPPRDIKPLYPPQPTPQFARTISGNTPLQVLSPMSQDDESEQRQSQEFDNQAEIIHGEQYGRRERDPEDDRRRTRAWRQSVEAAMVKMTAEMAALREQIATGREWKTAKRRTIGAWLGWLVYLVVRHVVIDLCLLGLLLFWLRKRKDSRFEDLVREAVKLGREAARRVLPPRVKIEAATRAR